MSEVVLTIDMAYPIEGHGKAFSLRNGNLLVWPTRGERLVRVDDGAAWSIIGVDRQHSNGERLGWAIERAPFGWPMVFARDRVGLLLSGDGEPKIGDRVVFAGSGMSVEDIVANKGLAKCSRCGSFSCAQSEYDCRTNGTSYGCESCGGDVRGTCRC